MWCHHAIMPSWKRVFSSQLCVNTISKIYGIHWLEKNILLSKGFDNSKNKICHYSVESQWFSETLAFQVLRICLPDGKILVGRVHINNNYYWDAVSLVMQNSFTWKNYQRARLAIPMHAFINAQKEMVS